MLWAFPQKWFTEDFMEEEKWELACWRGWVRSNGWEHASIESGVCKRASCAKCKGSQQSSTGRGFRAKSPGRAGGRQRQAATYSRGSQLSVGGLSWLTLPMGHPALPPPYWILTSLSLRQDWQLWAQRPSILSLYLPYQGAESFMQSVLSTGSDRKDTATLARMPTSGAFADSGTTAVIKAWPGFQHQAGLLSSVCFLLHIPIRWVCRE